MSGKNLEPLKELGNNYFKSLFRPKPKPTPKVTYSKNDLQIATRIRDGSVYTIDLREACRILVLGATRCMPLGTLVRTKDGVVKIEDAKRVLSYNFKSKKVEEKECVVSFSGKKKIFIIKTKYGDIRCSPNHKLYVKRNGKIEEVEAQNIKKTDKLLRVK